MVIAAVWVLSVCTMTAPYSVVDGVGNAMLGLVISVLDGVVARIGLCILLGNTMGLSGFWLGNALAGFVTTIMVFITPPAHGKSVSFCSNVTKLRSKSPKIYKSLLPIGSRDCFFAFTCSRAWRWFLPRERRMRQPEQGRG